MIKKNVFVVALLLSVIFFTGCSKKDTVVPVAVVVKAGNSQSIRLPLDSVVLTGVVKSGLTDNTIYLWTVVSDPSVPVFGHNNATSTVVGNLVAGKYILQFTATNNQGNTGTDTTSIIVNKEIIDTLSLQPTNNPDELSVGQINGVDAGTGSSTEMPIAAWTINGGPYNAMEVLKFDFSSIPHNATILSADIFLYSNPTPSNGDKVNANSGSDNAMVLQQITAPWVASNLSWSNPPQLTALNKVEIPATTSPFLDIDIDVKGMVSSIITQNANYGFSLKLSNQVLYNVRDFCSSFTSAYPDKHPKIIITYKRP